jgi:carboxyl-terminal processing protease
VQNLLDLDNLTRGREAVGLGQLKLTVAQFFRISGGSTQLKGVVPDIAFPVTLDAEDYGESSYDNALPWTSIAPLSHDHLADFEALTPLLTSRHQLRSDKDPELRWLKEDIQRYREQRDRKTLSLNFEARRAERDELAARRKARDAERKALGETIDEDTLLVDDGLQANERDLKEQLKREETADDDKPDALLREAVNVLVDAIDLLNDDRKLAAQVYPGKVDSAD